MGWNSSTKTVTYPFGTKIAASGATGTLQQIASSSSTNQITLFNSTNINPWARYKPYRSTDILSSPRTLALETLGFGASSSELPMKSTAAAFLALYDDTSILYGTTRANGWSYLRPRVAQGECLRCYDFLKMSSAGVPDQSATGYDGLAKNPFGSFNGPQNAPINGGRISASQQPLIPASGIADYDIAISDFNGLNLTTGQYDFGFLNPQMKYYGMALYPMDSNDAWTSGNARFIVNRTPIDDDGRITTRGIDSFNMNVGYNLQAGGSFSEGRYKAMPFLTTASFLDGLSGGVIRSVAYSSRNSAIGSGISLMSLPGAVPVIITIYTSDIVITVVFSPKRANPQPNGSYSASMYFTVTNNGSSSVTISDLTMKIRSVANWTAARQSGEVFYTKDTVWDDSNPSGASSTLYSGPLDNMTLAAGETKRIPSNSALKIEVTLPNDSTNTIFIGSPSRTNVAGSDTALCPINPSNDGLQQA